MFPFLISELSDKCAFINSLHTLNYDRLTHVLLKVATHRLQPQQHKSTNTCHPIRGRNKNTLHKERTLTFAR